MHRPAREIVSPEDLTGCVVMATLPTRMPATTPHTFPDVLVLIRRDGGWVCEIDRTPVWIGELQVEPGTVVPIPGARGPLTIAAFAVDNVKRQLRGVFS